MNEMTVEIEGRLVPAKPFTRAEFATINGIGKTAARAWLVKHAEAGHLDVDQNGSTNVYRLCDGQSWINYYHEPDKAGTHPSDRETIGISANEHLDLVRRLPYLEGRIIEAVTRQPMRRSELEYARDCLDQLIQREYGE